MSSEKKKIPTKTLWFYVGFALLMVGMALSLVVYFVSVDETNAFVGDNQTQTGNLDQGNVDDNQSGDNTGDIDDVEPTLTNITFIMPVNGTISKDYSEVPVFNSTLNRYSAHEGIDFTAEAGSEVFAVYKGTVSDVTNSITKGVTVTVDHGNGLFTVYNSLESIEDVAIGDKVEAGDVIGYVSTTNRQEFNDGAHLHFETIENGENINPSKYLFPEEK